MTDETRAELRHGIAKLVGMATHLPVDPDWPGYLRVRHNRRQYIVEVWLPENRDPPPLTTAQQLALSVLVGEPDGVVLSALCDLLIEQGHEYAVAVAEKAKREERERIVGLIRAWANDAYEAGEAEQSEMLTALVEVVEE